MTDSEAFERHRRDLWRLSRWTGNSYGPSCQPPLNTKGPYIVQLELVIHFLPFHVFYIWYLVDESQIN